MRKEIITDKEAQKHEVIKDSLDIVLEGYVKVFKRQMHELSDQFQVDELKADVDVASVDLFLDLGFVLY